MKRHFRLRFGRQAQENRKSLVKSKEASLTPVIDKMMGNN
jgi:hypothetical protein